MTGKQSPKKQSESRIKANEDIKRICAKSRSLKNESDSNSTPEVSSELAEALFGKVFGGNPETGEVPGARPMSDKEFYQFAYKALRRMAQDKEEFDKMFNMKELFGEDNPNQ